MHALNDSTLCIDKNITTGQWVFWPAVTFDVKKSITSYLVSMSGEEDTTKAMAAGNGFALVLKAAGYVSESLQYQAPPSWMARNTRGGCEK